MVQIDDFQLDSNLPHITSPLLDVNGYPLLAITTPTQN